MSCISCIIITYIFYLCLLLLKGDGEIFAIETGCVFISSFHMLLVHQSSKHQQCLYTICDLLQQMLMPVAYLNVFVPPSSSTE